MRLITRAKDDRFIFGLLGKSPGHSRFRRACPGIFHYGWKLKTADRIGFCGLGISQAPEARNVYSSGKKNARQLRQERHLSVDMPPRWG
jgi:hypothetical protein